MNNQKESDITDVLKALNHEVRRKIIRILYKDSSKTYSSFLDQLKLPASANVAYHLSLLTKANVIEKDKNNRYSLSDLGQRSALLLDLVSESKSSYFSNIFLGFSRLTPFETLLGAWWIFFVMAGLLLFPRIFIISLIFISFGIVSVFLFTYRTKNLWTILLINNFLWVYFAPENRHFLLIIIITNIFSLVFLFPNVETILGIPQYVFNILGVILLIISISLSILHSYEYFGIKITNILKK